MIIKLSVIESKFRCEMRAEKEVELPYLPPVNARLTLADTRNGAIDYVEGVVERISLDIHSGETEILVLVHSMKDLFVLRENGWPILDEVTIEEIWSDDMSDEDEKDLADALIEARAFIEKNK